MPIVEYPEGAAFPGVIGRTADESSPAWPAPPRARKGAPNVLFVVLDDTGFGQLGCYGSPIETPTFDALAADGLRFNNMHTTALCSPSRACIVTGRNHHSNGMACITEFATGYPGYNGIMPFENGMLSEMLLPARLQHVHGGQVAPDAEQPGDGGRARTTAGRWGAASSASTASWAATRASGTRSSSTTTTRSSRRGRPRRATTSPRTWSTSRSSSSPTCARSTPTSRSTCTSASARPTRRTTCPRSGPTGTPASSTTAGTPTASRSSPARRSWASSPADAELSRHDPDVPEWDSLSPEARRLSARMMEVFAGFLSHTDHHLGRLLDYLRAQGVLDNTIVMVISDNGASAEGGPAGTTNEAQFFNNAQETLEESLAVIDADRRPRALQPLPVGLDLRGQHAVPALEARDVPRRLHGPVHRLLAGRRQGARRGPHPVRPHHRHGAHGARPARRRAARGDPGRDPGAHRGRELRPRARRCRRPEPAPHAVLRDARAIGPSTRTAGARSARGRAPRSPRPAPGFGKPDLGRDALEARRHRLGALPRRRGPGREPRTSRRSTATSSSR